MNSIRKGYAKLPYRQLGRFGPNHSTIAKDYTSNTSPANLAAGTLLLNEEYAERERQRVRVCVRKRERERERERVSHPRVLI